MTALGEALTVIADLWHTERVGRTRFEGGSYQLAGAERGPAPAHTIPIWLGAYKSCSLRMLGTRADGCLPTMSYLDSLDSINDPIDAAAREAGRDPADIRRMLNLGLDMAHPDVLAHLATERGIDTLVLMIDDADTIRRFGHEVANKGGVGCRPVMTAMHLSQMGWEPVRRRPSFTVQGIEPRPSSTDPMSIIFAALPAGT